MCDLKIFVFFFLMVVFSRSRVPLQGQTNRYNAVMVVEKIILNGKVAVPCHAYGY